MTDADHRAACPRTLRIAALPLLLLALGCSRAPSTPAASAAGSEESRMPATMSVGDTEVLASVVPTLALNDAIAAQYGIDRARDRVLVLVSLRAGDDARQGHVGATARDLRGVRQSIAFREVRTGDLVDYVGIARVTPPDTLRLDIDVVLADGRRTTLRFSRDIARP
ncbi:DUF4426 domain-containing protein [Luteimonas sp. BDR2-5]|uniref:DUF4426 domain-containing protein n=1 Tax=Proluteimonas luteida TaxID=2878685 RepID=UPI001E5A992A|nr:DUF4426 domain-containing protein [Luteimonas sp. BDR2-5]MCD9028207.1 DUF4426 domain-containing protein [Luteimonas sp. BDR2-5]